MVGEIRGTTSKVVRVEEGKRIYKYRSSGDRYEESNDRVSSSLITVLGEDGAQGMLCVEDWRLSCSVWKTG
jgi:hypothetical protein